MKTRITIKIAGRNFELDVEAASEEKYEQQSKG